jgi:hypothetical protein
MFTSLLHNPFVLISHIAPNYIEKHERERKKEKDIDRTNEKDKHTHIRNMTVRISPYKEYRSYSQDWSMNVISHKNDIV